MSTTPLFVIITGGPGAGKTTLIDRLRGPGVTCVPEAGRAIIKDQRAIGGNAHHWGDAWLAAEITLAWEIRSYREASAATGTVFFDRGVPDVVGYPLLLGTPIPPHFAKAAELYRYDRVFIAPPWPEIYVNDTERKQDFAEAIRSYEVLVAAYTRCGYDLITLPKSDVDTRVAFIREHLAGVSRPRAARTVQAECRRRR